MSGAGGTADFFYREAQRLGYVARSAFKVSAFLLTPLARTVCQLLPSHARSRLLCPSQLIQIQKQHKLIAPGAAVLDLGCAPGAWLQVTLDPLLSSHQRDFDLARCCIV
jgi:23S rRNA U2552 (ribose-2'-O)-methylase RlmE/FtsJ